MEFPKDRIRQETAQSIEINQTLRALFTPLCRDLYNSAQLKAKQGIDTTNLIGTSPIVIKKTPTPRDPDPLTNFGMDTTETTVQFIISPKDAPVTNEILTVIPVGEYGIPLSLAIANSIRGLGHLAVSHLADTSRLIRLREPDLISEETYQNNPLASLIEGIHTVGTTFALFSFRKHGDMDPLRLYEQFISHALLPKFGALTPAGQVIPSAINCLGYVKPLTDNFKIDESLVETYRDLKRQKIARGETYPQSRYFGCPVAIGNKQNSEGNAFENSGIQLCTKAFGIYLNAFMHS